MTRPNNDVCGQDRQRFQRLAKRLQIVQAFKGRHTQTSSNAGASRAFRAGNAPGIMAVSRSETATMMAAKGRIHTGSDMMKEARRIPSIPNPIPAGDHRILTRPRRARGFIPFKIARMVMWVNSRW